MSCTSRKNFAFLLLLAVALLALSACNSSEQSVSAVDGRVTIPAADVSDGKAHYYMMKEGAKDVKFFLIRSQDGVIRAAFDACDVCFREKKGYVQEGEYMSCVNCGQKFHSSRINVVSGGCNPAPLARELQDGKITILASDIAAGSVYF